MIEKNATDELRAMLDERGVEWGEGGGLYQTEWTNKYGTASSAMEWKPTLTVTLSGLTPKQAIAATLGNDQELIDLAHNAWSMALCAMQGIPIPAEWGEAVECGLREHGINVDMELEGFEMSDDEC